MKKQRKHHTPEQKEFFENGAAAFEPASAGEGADLEALRRTRLAADGRLNFRFAD